MPRGLARLSVAELMSELRRRRSSAGRLQGKRSKLAAKIAGLDEEIKRLGGTANGAGGRPGAGTRPRNSMTLNAALAKVLKGKPMSVGDAMAAVQKAGYRTNSNSFRTQVNIAL